MLKRSPVAAVLSVSIAVALPAGAGTDGDEDSGNKQRGEQGRASENGDAGDAESKKMASKEKASPARSSPERRARGSASGGENPDAARPAGEAAKGSGASGDVRGAAEFPIAGFAALSRSRYESEPLGGAAEAASSPIARDETAKAGARSRVHRRLAGRRLRVGGSSLGRQVDSGLPAPTVELHVSGADKKRETTIESKRSRATSSSAAAEQKASPLDRALERVSDAVLARRPNMTGRAMVAFTVTAAGKLRDVLVVGFDAELDKKLERVLGKATLPPDRYAGYHVQTTLMLRDGNVSWR